MAFKNFLTGPKWYFDQVFRGDALALANPTSFFKRATLMSQIEYRHITTQLLRLTGARMHLKELNCKLHRESSQWNQSSEWSGHVIEA